MSGPPGHPFVAVRVRPEELELAELQLWELGATGLEERDHTTLVRRPADGHVVVMACFPDETAARHALSELRPDYECDLSYAPHQDWATEWRRGFGAQRIGKRLLLHPSWEAVETRPGDVVLTVDPENAFGSGDHETTRLVLRVLEERVSGAERVLDVGCGSGILSIAALRLGAASAVAIDIEADAVAVTRRNAELNAASSGIDVSTRPLSEIDGRYDIVLANIETRVLVHMPDELRARVDMGGMLVLSGVLRGERDEILAAYSAMELEACLEEGEWLAFVLRAVVQ
jgi:ribosomal protein L11 methyltransferase